MCRRWFFVRAQSIRSMTKSYGPAWGPTFDYRFGLVGHGLRSRNALGVGKHLYLADMGGTRSYDHVDWTQPSALVVGGEANGASKQARETATIVNIPMLGSAESLNAGIAGAVILFEAARQRRELMR